MRVASYGTRLLIRPVRRFRGLQVERRTETRGKVSFHDLSVEASRVALDLS